MVYFFDPPAGSSEQGLICNAVVKDEFTRQEEVEANETSRRTAHYLFSVDRYRDRWCFGQSESGEEFGIPRAELEASAVENPHCKGELWLLHRKAFTFTPAGLVDPACKVPICADCKVDVGKKKPGLPKYALANDLWIGAMPKALRGLSEGAWLLLPLARCLMKRFNCKSDMDKRWRPPSDQMIKALVGNVCVFPQADGGKVLTSLPPTAEELIDSLAIVFTGPAEDMLTGFHKDLGVDPAVLKEAYDFLLKHNKTYSQTRWDEGKAAGLQLVDGCLGFPKVFMDCLRRQDVVQGDSGDVRQYGPADAVETGTDDQLGGGLTDDAGGEVPLAQQDSAYVSETLALLRQWLEQHPVSLPQVATDDKSAAGLSEAALSRRVSALIRVLDSDSSVFAEHVLEEARVLLLPLLRTCDVEEEKEEVVIGAADDDVQMDSHKQFAHVEAQLRRLLQKRSQVREQEKKVRESDSSMADFTNAAARDDVAAAAEEVAKSLQQLNFEKMDKDLQAAEDKVERFSAPPGVQCRKKLPEAKLVKNAAGRICLLVPGASQALSMFEPSFWSSVDPRSFPYGDGVYGIDRDTKLSFDEWARYLLQREELVYDSVVGLAEGVSLQEQAGGGVTEGAGDDSPDAVAAAAPESAVRADLQSYQGGAVLVIL